MEGQARGARRWAVAAVAVLAVLAAALAVPRLLEDDDEPRVAAPGTECVAEADASFADTGAAGAQWVRFCPLADEGRAGRARHPQGVVTGDLAASVADGLWETQVGRPSCGPDVATLRASRLFRIEVGLADGRVADLTGDTGCSTREVTLFSQLETTLLMEAGPAADPAAPPPAPARCPARFTTTATNADGSSAGQLVDTAGHPWQSTVPLLPLPATWADVCAYRGGGRQRELVDQWQVGQPTSDAIRTEATLGYRDGVTDCRLRPRLTSYVVVLTDATGTARTLALDPTQCATLSAAVGAPAVDTYLGLAGPELVALVADSRPAVRRRRGRGRRRSVRGVTTATARRRG